MQGKSRFAISYSL